ncbi:MAG: sigma-70 family RNA polymerase sigma factor [Gammaproteobacteria bacterium]|nr:MAG: sigma-70 family RNA polymerase sigma factor [Gammaproteobacteria bacterium]
MKASLTYLTSDEESVSREIPKTLSIENLVSNCHISLVSFLRRRLRVGEDARDVAQEAYIRLMQYEGSKDVKSPESLLFRIAINIANDLGRADKVRHLADHCDIDGLEFDSGIASPEREVSASQQLDLLYATIEQLPPKCRQVFLLSRFQNMTYPQIAVHCGISVKMVEKHISRALAICAAKSS